MGWNVLDIKLRSFPKLVHSAFNNLTFKFQQLPLARKLQFGAGGLLILGLVGWAGVVLNSSSSAQDGLLPDVDEAASATVEQSVTPPAVPEPTQSSVSVESHTTTRGSNTEVSVNGQSVSVPSNGSVNKTVVNEDGSQTTVEVNNSSSSSSSTRDSSSRVRVRASSNTKIKQQIDSEVNLDI